MTNSVPINPKRYTVPAPSTASSSVLLAGLVLAYISIPAQVSATEMIQPVAVIVGLALTASILIDCRKGLQNVFRTDLICLVATYYLTLAEFLFPQDIDAMFKLNGTEGITTALSAILLGIGGLTVGRHLVQTQTTRSHRLNFGDVSSKSLFRVFICSALLGYFYMLMSVDFDFARLIDAMLQPRFSQPWGRGKLGDWRVFFQELALLIYIVPGLSGIIWNRRRDFSILQLVAVLSILLLTLFYGFASGTRNIFISYIMLLVMGYLVTLPRYRIINTVIPVALTMGASLFASHYMVQFRNIGLLNYLNDPNRFTLAENATLSIDYNIYSIRLIVDNFPQVHDYLGWEILYWCLIRPIPRVLFPWKPTELSVSIESLAGASGYTMSATYIGESYMMAGMLGVLAMSLALGALAAWWNRLALQKQSAYAMIMYSLGFGAAGITMRSLLWFTTMILPIVLLWLLKAYGIVRLRRIRPIP
jgi:hypothetical protein